jgi:purine nucleosidase
MMKIVIDTDPGIDDAHAIMLALAYPGVEVKAITTVAGNVPLERTTANSLILLDVLEKNVPVFRGCSDALVVPTSRRAISHGTDGFGDSGYPSSVRQAQPEHAAPALCRLASEIPGELTLVALGPLTNLALATQIDPELPSKYRRLVVMGGAIYARGNSWTPAAEFNFYIDPEAAAIVFSRWPEITLVPWETCENYALTPELMAELAEIDTARAAFFRRLFKNRLSQQLPQYGVCFDPDFLAMVVALESDTIRRMERRALRVEVAGELTRGQSVVDWYGITGYSPNTNLVLEVDRERYQELIRLSLQ